MDNSRRRPPALRHIVAASENDIIGRENGLPWNIPEDTKFFREKTKGHVLIMGRKTFESIGKPLPKRLTIIVTRSRDYRVEGCIVVGSVEEALDESRKHLAEYDKEVFIAGGGEIYRLAMPYTDRIYLTRIHRNVDGDTTYPQIDREKFRESERVDRDTPESFSFLTYDRVKS